MLPLMLVKFRSVSLYVCMYSIAHNAAAVDAG